MAEIIQFPGPKNKKEEKPKSPETKERGSSCLNQVRLTEVLKILNALKNADVGSFGQRTIDRKRNVVSGYTDEELFGWINNYTEENIKKHPSFFGAIIDELRYRELC